MLNSSDEQANGARDDSHISFEAIQNMAMIEEEYEGMDCYLRQVLDIDVERIQQNYLV
ncbi:hypothetical protein [Collimonas antrihumi]|uniref:hypothetical protein n=1 Tax=Collimonas antrihumi TaxID=1940615 RepID=UPI001B8AF100|nr:hypothetical protein [Collimonas antrihumi]